MVKIQIPGQYQDQESYQCGLCGYMPQGASDARPAAVKRRVLVHIKSVHSKSQNIECSLCGKSFKNSESCRVHMKVYCKNRTLTVE
jgi:hypothetical protein